MSGAAFSKPFTQLARGTWPHPEWWTIGLSVLAWLAIAMKLWGAPHDHAAMVHSERPVAWPDGMLHWSLMVVAMMLPLVLDAVRITAARSLWARRHRAIAGFLLGYLGVWTIAGVVFCLGTSPLAWQPWLFPWLPPAAAGFALAAIWQLIPVKSRAMRSCHRTMPLAPRGWRADRDCLKYGWIVGSHCLLSCWALMLACALAGHSFPAMLGATVVGIAERYTPKPDQRIICGAIAAFTLAYLTLRLR